MEADILSAPAAECLCEGMSPIGVVVETDFPIDREVTDAELEAIIRLLGGDLVRLLGELQSH